MTEARAAARRPCRARCQDHRTKAGGPSQQRAAHFNCHCERSEAIQSLICGFWIASSLALLAMTLERINSTRDDGFQRVSSYNPESIAAGTSPAATWIYQ